MLLAATVLSGCGTDLPSRVRGEGVAAAAIVHLDDRLAVAARAADGRVEVVAFRRARAAWTAEVIGGTNATVANANSVALFGWEGETGEAWNTFIYGTAEASVSRVVLEGLLGVGGRVIAGAWVIGLRTRGIQPADLHWRFVDAGGAVVTEGTGILTTDGGPTGAFHRRWRVASHVVRGCGHGCG